MQGWGSGDVEGAERFEGAEGVEDLLRDLAPRVLGALVRRYGHFDLAEDAVQEALIAAAAQWTTEPSGGTTGPSGGTTGPSGGSPGGVPENPRGWLITVASRRLTDLLRAEQARRRREDRVARWTLPEEYVAPGADEAASADGSAYGKGAESPANPVEVDDTLVLLFLCCDPALSTASRIALTLRAVGGLTTGEIARAFLVPEATMTRRITRAKDTIRRAGMTFRAPRPEQRAERLDAVLRVLYLIFTEGYASTAGARLQRVELAAEAIRLTRIVRRRLPEDSEVAGLLALMLLTYARRNARAGPTGELIPMAEQDRARWDPSAIAEGVALVEAALPRGPVGAYQVQAAIAALHDEAPSAEATDWPQILALYDVLVGLPELAGNPVVALNRVVALAMVEGPAAGLAALDAVAGDRRLARDHRPVAVRAHLLERAGELEAARQAYDRAAALATNVPQRRYLNAQAARLS